VIIHQRSLMATPPVRSIHSIASSFLWGIEMLTARIHNLSGDRETRRELKADNQRLLHRLRGVGDNITRLSTPR